jgi:hypothetical protein
MTPATITSKARALKAHLERVAEDVAVLLLRLVELQLSGAAGEPRHSQKRRAGSEP